MNLMAIIVRVLSRLRLAVSNFSAKEQKSSRAAESPPSAGKAIRQKSKLLIFVLSLLFGLSVTQVYAAYPPRRVVQQSQTPSEMVTVGHTREFRGVWTATVANIDWPSKPGMPVEQQKAELLSILNRMQALNLNALVLQVRPAGDALYASQLEPWSYWLTGTQGKAPTPYYDPLEFAIAESHKRNIELHAWFNPYRAKTPDKFSLAGNHMAKVYPQYAYQYGDLLWMDPGAKPVQDRTYDVIMDVVRRYDVDGIHLDDYFYPYPKSGISFPDSRTYGAYKAAGGTFSLADWRRDNVNQLMQRLAKGIRAEKPHVKFGISPFGIYRPGQPAGIVGLDQYNELYADAKKWLEEGWVDYLAPQLYWRIDPPQQSYPALLTWWTQHNPKRRHIYAGNYLSQLNGGSWTVSEFKRQVEITRKMAPQLSLGNIFFSMKVFKENRLGVNEAFRSALYPSPALPPAMPWLDNEPPAPPSGITVTSNYVTWDKPAANDVRSWTLYTKAGNTWKLLRVIPSSITAFKVERGTYALSAVDDTANESQAVVVSIR
ncbi:glycoside hydrolase family 10 protein [Microcoleus sp. FACHB-672]|uniref:glycoside hydrolase family 10 protein n=1 Tax=Microcoleus sp. FACHB-672 TaxID=2692825 RepID=UPI00168539A5|nr:family 10 glycosylhydrolase [Microcoleus sp. FACHB-672]MBD2039997.1 family 10 glycosylhydrolase [Microcoleus sp. FACHB-672]